MSCSLRVVDIYECCWTSGASCCQMFIFQFDNIGWTTLTTVGLVSLAGTQIIQTNISLVCTYSSDRYGELKLTKSKINKWLTKWINAINAPKVILKQMKALIAWLYMLCIARFAINQPIGKTLTTWHTVNDRPLICIRKQICINKYCTCGEINREII